jgi:hypothetical protein
MMDHVKFKEMQKIFQRKNASSLERKVIVKVKIIIVDVHVVDVNVDTISIITQY